MKIKRICFLAGIYPTEQKPNAGVFYKNLVYQFAQMGIECKVIHPMPINHGEKVYKSERIETVDDKNSVIVYQPKTITLGAKKLGPFNTAYATACLYYYSAKSVLKRLDWKPDVFYGHFISPAGVMAAKLSKDTGIPAFIAYGESEPWSIKTIGPERTKELLNTVKGFISVSSKNKSDLLKYKIAEANDIKVFPNAINHKVFYKREKTEARKKNGLG